MFTFILVIHVIVSLLLMLVILLQDGKGGDIVSALGGGGSQSLFGSSGAGNFLTKATITLTVIFVLSSLSLAVLKTRSQRSVLDGVAPETTVEEPAVKPEEATTPETGDAVVPEDTGAAEPAVTEPAPATDEPTAETQETAADTGGEEPGK